MFGWLKRKAQIAATSAMRADVDRFILALRGADPHEVGGVLACTYHWMHKLNELYGWDLRQPYVVDSQDPAVAIKINRLLREVQQRQQVLAPGLMVWLHTVRATQTPELRVTGREMWTLLLRGSPHLREGAEMFALYGMQLDRSRAGQVPDNLVSSTVEDEGACERPGATEADVELIAACINGQMAFDAIAGRAFPTDPFSTGYVFGSADAFLQRRGIEPDDARASATLIGVFASIYGPFASIAILDRTLELQAEPGLTNKGIVAGGGDMTRFLRTLQRDAPEIPMSLARYHVAARDAQPHL